LLCLLALALPQTAFAHPLGNFTINRYSRLEVQPGLVRIRYVLDEAEIPTYQELSLLHANGDKPTAQEQAAFLTSRAEQLRSNLHLAVGRQPVTIDLEPGSTALSFPPGQGGLSLLRVTAWYRAALPGQATQAVTDVSFQDANYSDRLGWKEIIVRAADGVALQQSSVTAVDQSDELRSYPQDMLSSPLDVRGAQFSFAAGAASAGSNGAAQTGLSSLLQPRGKSSGLLQAATDAFTGLISRQTLSLPFIALALLVAVALGGVHALSPGHGKTVVGAYLVGARGSAGDAAFLGLTVTVTHTAGVFALGAITLFASRYIVPERLYPWLSAISGLLVVAIGAWLLFVRLRAALRPPLAAQSANWHDEQIPIEERGRPARPGGRSLHGNTSPLGDGDRDAVAGAGGTPALPVQGDVHHHEHGHSHDMEVIEHDHGTGRHTHVVPARSRITWRGLLALGISGGLLPCPSALVVLLAAISLHRVAFGIVLVLAFSAGLAGVLTGIGLLLVYARGLFARFRLEVGAGRLLPALSAAVVLVLGLAITLQALAQSGLSL